MVYAQKWIVIPVSHASVIKSVYGKHRSAELIEAVIV